LVKIKNNERDVKSAYTCTHINIYTYINVFTFIHSHHRMSRGKIERDGGQ